MFLIELFVILIFTSPFAFAQLICGPGTSLSFTKLGSGWNSNVSVSSITSIGSDIYAGGNTNFNGNTTRIAKFDGSNWTSLSEGITGGYVGSMTSIGNSLFAAGSFTSINNVPNTAYIAGWNGTNWFSLGSQGPNQKVEVIIAMGTNLYIGGFFTTTAGISGRLVGWNGTSYFALGTGIPVPTSYCVFSLAVNGTNLYVGGNFTVAGGYPILHIARWDGASWDSLGNGIEDNRNGLPLVMSILIVGKYVYAAGRFRSAAGVPNTRGLAKWDGSNWTPVGPVGFTTNDTSNYIATLALLGGNIFLGGYFVNAGQIVGANYLAGFNGTNYFPTTFTTSSVNAIQATNDSLYFTSGPFDWILRYGCTTTTPAPTPTPSPTPTPTSTNPTTSPTTDTNTDSSSSGSRTSVSTQTSFSEVLMFSMTLIFVSFFASLVV